MQPGAIEQVAAGELTDGRTFVAARTSSGVLIVWDVEDSRVLHAFPEQVGRAPISVGQGPNGALVVAGGDPPLVWEADGGRRLGPVQPVEIADYRADVAVGPGSEGSWLVTTTTERRGTIRRWDGVSGELVHAWDGHEGVVTDPEYGYRSMPQVDAVATGWLDPTTPVLATVGTDAVRVWHAATDEPLLALGRPGGVIAGMAIECLGGVGYLALALRDGQVRVWALPAGTEVAAVACAPHVTSLSAGCGLLAVNGSGGGRLWGLPTLEEVLPLDAGTVGRDVVGRPLAIGRLGGEATVFAGGRDGELIGIRAADGARVSRQGSSRRSSPSAPTAVWSAGRSTDARCGGATSPPGRTTCAWGRSRAFRPRPSASSRGRTPDREPSPSWRPSMATSSAA